MSDEPRELEAVKRELTNDLLRNHWDQGSRLQGMLSALGIESVLGTIPDKYGELDPVISIPIKHYDQLVRMIANAS